MKKHSIDIYALLFIAILFLITRLLSGCAASRDVQKDKNDVKTEEHIDQTRDNVTNSVTKTDESIVANTEVTETIDTLIRIPDPRTGLMINVPVHEKKVTKKQEYGTKKTENVSTGHEKEAIKGNIKQETIIQDKKLATKGQPWAKWISIVCGIIVVLLFVFLWKKFQLGRIFSGVIRKSP